MASMSLPPSGDSMLKAVQKGMCSPNKKPIPNLSGKTVLITGSNSGIGLACSQILPTLGVTHLIMAVRSISKGEEAASPIRATHPKMQIDVMALDMSSYTSILDFVGRVERLDIAIFNAGMSPGPTPTFNKETGHEETAQVNYLSTALLSILLLPSLSPLTPTSPPGRLLIVGSGTALFASFTNISSSPLLPSFDIPFSGFAAASERYGTSKVLVMMLVHKLSQVVPAHRVIINTVEPGLTSGTGLHRDLSGGGAVMMGLMKRATSKTPEQAAYTYVDAVGEKGAESHGGFVMFWEVVGMPKIMYTEEGRSAMERLWMETVVELEFAGVKQILGLGQMGQR